jgi:hypothetical protein
LTFNGVTVAVKASRGSLTSRTILRNNLTLHRYNNSEGGGGSLRLIETLVNHVLT